MEIKIQSLESIHEAAREFIAAMGDNTVNDIRQSTLRSIGRNGCYHFSYFCYCQRIPFGRNRRVNLSL